jgi:membrane protein implicated in regulation of membrane protease activity
LGFVVSLGSFLMHWGHIHAGNGHGHIGVEHFPDGHTHVGHVTPGHSHAGHIHSTVLSKFNFSTITAFLTWFGGAGYLLSKYTSLWTLLALAVAAATGIAGAAMVFWFLAKLVARDRTLNPADFDMIGVLGCITSTVQAGGTGELSFTQDGARKGAPARSEDGTPIPRGVEVVVTRYENGVAYVRRWEELAG